MTNPADTLEALIEKMAESGHERVIGFAKDIQGIIAPAWRDLSDAEMAAYKLDAMSTFKAIETAGWRVVPKLANKDMFLCAMETDRHPFNMWQAMLDAAPKLCGSKNPESGSQESLIIIRERQPLLDPDMPDQQMRLHGGEMTAQEIRTARAFIRLANSRIGGTHDA